MNNNQLLRFPAQADYTCLHLDYSGNHKNRIHAIIVLVYIVLWKICKNYCEKCKQILFVLVKIQGETHQAATPLETIQVLALFSQGCAVRTAHGIVCRYNWMADYTIIMPVHKITRILKISRGLLTNQNADSEFNV